MGNTCGTTRNSKPSKGTSSSGELKKTLHSVTTELVSLRAEMQTLVEYVGIIANSSESANHSVQVMREVMMPQAMAPTGTSTCPPDPRPWKPLRIESPQSPPDESFQRDDASLLDDGSNGMSDAPTPTETVSPIESTTLSPDPEPPKPTLPPPVPSVSPPQPTLDSTINLSISTVAEDVLDQLVVTSAGYHGSEDFIVQSGWPAHCLMTFRRKQKQILTSGCIFNPLGLLPCQMHW